MAMAEMTGRHYTSPGLIKHGDSQEVVQLAFFVMAALFDVFARAVNDQIMPAEVYGKFATSIPAEYWSGSIMLASVVYLYGIKINGRWRWSPALRLLGAAWHTMTLFAFAASAVTAQYGDFFTLSCVVFGCVHLWFVWLNTCDLVLAVGYGKHSGRQ